MVNADPTFKHLTQQHAPRKVIEKLPKVVLT